MRIGVQMSGLEPKVADRISIHLNTKWDPSKVIVFRDEPAEGELDGLLLLGGSKASPYSEALITEAVDVPTGCGESGASMDDVLFQTDAKLGRLSSSYLAKQSTRSFLTREATLSRRELFTGVRRGFRKYSGLPLIFSETCEAKRGCSKCVAVCPAKALRTDDGLITLSEAACTACGICAAVCPTGAVQMPEFSDAALLGLLDEIDESSAPSKTLVLTCDSGAIHREPGMVVEQISSVGMLGPRQIAAAAASSLGGVAVVCPDGECAGKGSTMTTVGALSGSIAGVPSAPFIVFIEGADSLERLSALHGSSKARSRRAPRSGDRWKDFIDDLAALIPPEGPTSGLGLTGLKVSESCTLCSACAVACPHGSLRLDERHVFFNASTCTGCGLCVSTCPERSITLSSSSGRMSQVTNSERVYQDELVACAKCGAPIGSVKFINRVTTLLGPDSKFEKYCPKCKAQVVRGTLFGSLNRG